jgi:hypothetical protein
MFLHPPESADLVDALRTHYNTVERFRMRAADKVLLVATGAGNAGRLKRPPKGCRMGDNAHAFLDGFRIRNGVTP